MKYVLAVLVAAVPLWLAWASWRGRVRMRCCGIAASQDTRMRDAYATGAPVPAPDGRSPTTPTPVSGAPDLAAQPRRE